MTHKVAVLIFPTITQNSNFLVFICNAPFGNFCFCCFLSLHITKILAFYGSSIRNDCVVNIPYCQHCTIHHHLHGSTLIKRQSPVAGFMVQPATTSASRFGSKLYAWQGTKYLHSVYDLYNILT